jgi:hypothetical protein
MKRSAVSSQQSAIITNQETGNKNQVMATETPSSAQFPRLPFVLLAASLGIAGCTGIGLAFDGSYLWFLAVEMGAPYIVHNRVINILFQAGPLLASRYLHQPQVISAIFSLVYLLPPLAGCLLSWMVIRRRAPGLMLWSVGWVLLAILPGQMEVVSEANIVLQLFWPVFLMVLLGVRLRDLPLILALAILAVCAYPTSVVLLGLAALLSIAVGLHRRAHLRMNGITSVLLLGIGAMNLLRLIHGLTGYEVSMLNIGTLEAHFWPGMAGEPLIFVLLAWGAMGVVLRRAVHRTPIEEPRNLYIPIGLLILGGLLLGLRAALPFRWEGIVSYHFYSLFVALPFLGMAAIDVYHSQQHPGHALSFTSERRRVTQAAMLVAAGVMTIHAISWQMFASQLRSSLAASPGSCLSVDETPELAWGRHTILEHWSVTVLSLWVQPNPPTKLMVFEPRCTDQSFEGDFQLAPWLRYEWGYHWFDLRPLGASLQPDG